MTKGGKVVEVARREGKAYLRKAREFLDLAELALERQRYDAAMLTSIHAGISAADALTSALAGIRSADPNHQKAADLVEEVVGKSFSSQLRSLRLLIGKKNIVEYQPGPATAKEAQDTLKRATRFVAWVEQQVE